MWGIMEETDSKGRIMEKLFRGMHEDWKEVLVP